MSHTPAQWDYDPGDRVTVAKKADMGHAVYVASDAEVRLMAAAPNLLAALQELLSWDTLAPKDTIEQAKAAIAKAKGEA